MSPLRGTCVSPLYETVAGRFPASRGGACGGAEAPLYFNMVSRVTGCDRPQSPEGFVPVPWYRTFLSHPGTGSTHTGIEASPNPPDSRRPPANPPPCSQRAGARVRAKFFLTPNYILCIMYTQHRRNATPTAIISHYYQFVRVSNRGQGGADLRRVGTRRKYCRQRKGTAAVSSFVPNKPNRRRRPERSRTDPNRCFLAENADQTEKQSQLQQAGDGRTEGGRQRTGDAVRDTSDGSRATNGAKQSQFSRFLARKRG